ncbi:MAG: DUF420 domain-containing protein [Saprospiraceae bacterium]|nr:DUF420 domain-containing protein [Saprospiraceae bacterium]
MKKTKRSNFLANVVAILISVVVAGLVSVLARTQFEGADQLPWNVKAQPGFHALMNSLTALSLLIGFYFIKQGNRRAHAASMVSGLVFSAFFLVSYVIYHSLTESTSFGGEGVIKYVYYFILVTHIILAALILPFILITVHRAFTKQFAKHKAISKWVFPIWLYVAITGVVVYFLIRPYY